MLFLTTPDEPKITVSKLKTRSINNSTTNSNYYTSFVLNEHTMLNGTWSLVLSNNSTQTKVQIVLKKVSKSTNKFSKKQQKLDQNVDHEHVFRLVINNFLFYL